LKNEIIITKDGSHSIYVPVLDEHYHSVYGAIQESQHIFINYGLKFIKNQNISILDIGFGTGLNALLTIVENENLNKRIKYTTIEKYPLEKSIYEKLNYCNKLKSDYYNVYMQLHNAEWERGINILPNFSLTKIQTDLIEYKPVETFDIVYFDAFAPNIQAKLWTEEVFAKIYNAMNIEGVLTTYSAKGSVKRAMKAAGFKIEELPGPEGKRVVTRAIKD